MKLFPKSVSKEISQILLLTSAFWTIAIMCSLIWNIAAIKQKAVEISLSHARESFNKVLLVRKWIALHGGVYVPVTDKTPPNPHLSFIQERDVRTPSGRQLTLINPAYMTRQLYELAHLTDTQSGHITSLYPIRPENRPDEWEAQALKRFENGSTEVYSLIAQDGKDYMRFMRPLLMEKVCLKCHARQGYSKGMIRGGISVTVLMPTLYAITWQNNIALFSAHFLLWIIGIILISFGGYKINNAILQRKLAEDELAQANLDLEGKVALRTTEYEQANEQLKDEIISRLKAQEKIEYAIKQWRETFDVMSDFVSVHDKDMRFVRVNKSLADCLGEKPGELIGKHCYELMHNSLEPWSLCPHVKAIEKQEVVTEEIDEPYLKKTLLVTCSPFFNIRGELTGTVHVARDISGQKLDQKEREERVTKLQASLNEIKTLRGILPICSFCKKIRDNKGNWQQVEAYVKTHTEADFSHGCCPECAKIHYGEYVNKDGKLKPEK